MKNIYAIHDRIADEIIGMRMYALMVFRTNEEAARYFADAINDTTSVLNKHPGDFQLIHLGHLNDNSTITPNPQGNALIITGDALVAVQQPALVKEA